MKISERKYNYEWLIRHDIIIYYFFFVQKALLLYAIASLVFTSIKIYIAVIIHKILSPPQKKKLINSTIECSFY